MRAGGLGSRSEGHRVANRMSRAAALWALMRRCEVSEFEITEQEMDQIASSLPTLTMFRCPTKNVVIVRAEHHND